MLCSHCQAPLTDSFQYCPQCGHKVENGASTTNSEVPALAPIQESVIADRLARKRHMPFWFKFIVFVAVIALIGVTGAILMTEKIVDVVDLQLAALKKSDDDKAYYDYTSKDFQATTSLEQFKNFIHTYPVFRNNLSSHFQERSFDHHLIVLKGGLLSDTHVDTPIEYRLIKEDNKWKILSIRLLKPEAIPNATEASNSDDLIDVAKDQLKAIQKNQLENAYNQFLSTEFKAATSEEAFQEFIKRYPVLTHYHTLSFHKPMIRNGIGKLSVILQSEQIAGYIKYYFIYEDQKWKIWSMRILSPSEIEKRKKNKKNRSV